jgi:glycosyltransferase involved in cell wall biosynthesis
MKILILYRHFWPDSPPYASMLRSIAKRLVRDGHDVTIWTLEPSYKRSDWDIDAPRFESIDGATIVRSRLLPGFRKFSAIRVLDKVLFPPRLIGRSLWARLTGQSYDLVWTATIPPVVQGMVGRWIAKLFSARMLYHCQDLYPELGVHSGIWKKGGVVDSLLASIERRNRAKANVLVGLSEDMAQTIRGLADPEGHLAVINNFMLEDFSSSAATKSTATRTVSSQGVDRSGNLRLIFAGNLGAFQGLEKLVEAMRFVSAKRQDIDLVFMGEGKALENLQSLSQGLANVHFEGHRPFEDAKRDIAASDVGIVSLEPGIYRLAFPSKTLTYLGLGLPLLCLIEPESELALMVANHRLGWSVAPNPEGIASTILEIAERREELPQMHANTAQWFEEHLSREALLDRWSALIGDLSAQSE